MREIKYRIWNGKYFEYCHIGKDYHVVFDLGFGFSLYTGLKDKNGKEIYEGDVVKLQDRLYQVVYSSEYACWQIVSVTDEEETYEHLADIDTDMEVVGNVYENPELLKA